MESFQEKDRSVEDEEHSTIASVDIEIAHPVSKQPTFGKTLFLLCGIINFGMSYGVPTSLAIFFLEWQDAFKQSRARTAVIHATCMGMLNTLAILPSLVMQRFGARYTLLMGSLLASAGLALSIEATDVIYMTFTIGVMVGLGCSMINLPTIPCITAVFKIRQSIIIASLTVGAAVANAVLPFFYRYLAYNLTWRGACLIISSVLLHTCISSLVITSFCPSTTSTKNMSLSAHQGLLIDVESSRDHLSPDKDQSSFAHSNNLLAAISSQSSLRGSNAFVNQVIESKSFTSTEQIHNDEWDEISKGKTSLNRFNSKYPFLFDHVFIVHVISLSFLIAALYGFIALLMDYTRSRGYGEENAGAVLVFIFFMASMCGKILSGLLNLFPKLHSFYLLSAYGVLGGVTFIVVNHIDEYILLCVTIAVLGIMFGGIAAIYPKCVLDIDSVCDSTYPIALGITNTAAGVCDIVLPILIGYSVDQFDSYMQILYVYGFVGCGLSILLLVTFCYKSK